MSNHTYFKIQEKESLMNAAGLLPKHNEIYDSDLGVKLTTAERLKCRTSKEVLTVFFSMSHEVHEKTWKNSPHY